MVDLSAAVWQLDTTSERSPLSADYSATHAACGNTRYAVEKNIYEPSFSRPNSALESARCVDFVTKTTDHVTTARG
jgi:hypothetical protein